MGRIEVKFLWVKLHILAGNVFSQANIIPCISIIITINKCNLLCNIFYVLNFIGMDTATHIGTARLDQEGQYFTIGLISGQISGNIGKFTNEM